MEPTNRPITSREYKLLLNTERFRDRPDGTGLFWKLVEFLVKNQGNEVIPVVQDQDENEEKKRTTWYLDTPGFELRRNNVTVRMRDREGSNKRYQVTLKYRAPDRYTAAGHDVSCTEDVDEDDIKFEEDVVPPFVSRFSYSVSFKKKNEPQIATMADVVKLFPGLDDLGISPDTPIQKVNGFQAHEVVQTIGKIKLEDMPVAFAAAAADAEPRFVVKASLSHWYLLDNEDDYPLVTEFSFSFDADGQGDEDQLEKFPPTVVAGANRLFRDLQNQAGWLAQFGTTKTAYVFDVM